MSAVVLVVVLAINHWLHGEKIPADELLSGGILAFFIFGLLNTFTDKIGSSFGDN